MLENENINEPQSPAFLVGAVSGSNKYQVYFYSCRRNNHGELKCRNMPPIISGITKKKAIDLCNKLAKDMHMAGYVGQGYYSYKQV